MLGPCRWSRRGWTKGDTRHLGAGGKTHLKQIDLAFEPHELRSAEDNLKRPLGDKDMKVADLRAGHVETTGLRRRPAFEGRHMKFSMGRKRDQTANPTSSP